MLIKMASKRKRKGDEKNKRKDGWVLCNNSDSIDWLFCHKFKNEWLVIRSPSLLLSFLLFIFLFCSVSFKHFDITSYTFDHHHHSSCFFASSLREFCKLNLGSIWTQNYYWLTTSIRRIKDNGEWQYPGSVNRKS